MLVSSLRLLLQKETLISRLCPDEGTPAGKEDTIHGLPTYVTEPPDGTAPKGVVVVIPDAFGWKLNNNRILADQYAKRIGVIVYLPDFMNGMAPRLATRH